jgi:hypothetical protein
MFSELLKTVSGCPQTLVVLSHAPDVPWWKDGNLWTAVGAIGTLIAAVGACATVVLIYKQYIQQIADKNKEEALKTPIIQVNRCLVLRTDDPNDPKPFPHISSIALDMFNPIDEPLKELKYSFFVVDLMNQIVNINPLSKPKRGTTTIGNPVRIATTIATERGFHDTMFRIAIYCMATDIRDRAEPNQKLYYTINTVKSEGGIEEIIPWPLTNDETSAKIDVAIHKWHNEHIDINKTGYWPE